MDILTKTNLTAGGETTTDLLTSSYNIVNKEGVSELISDNNTYLNRLIDNNNINLNNLIKTKVSKGEIDDYIFKDADPILSNKDLNDYIIPGKYYVDSGTIAKTLENCPFDDNGFTLIVEGQYNTENYIGQTIISNNANSFVKLFRRLTVSSNSWTAWTKVGGYCAASLISNRPNTPLSNASVSTVLLNDYKYRTVTKFSILNYGLVLPYNGIVIASGSVYITVDANNYQQRAGVFVSHRRNSSIILESSNYGIGVGALTCSSIFNVQAGDVIYLYGRSYDGSGIIYNNASTTHLDVAYL